MMLVEGLVEGLADGLAVGLLATRLRGDYEVTRA